MDTRPLKALEIEALTYIYEPETSTSPAERDRWWRESFRAHAIMVGVSLGVALLAALTWALMPVAGNG
jgi:hypothetical protein